MGYMRDKNGVRLDTIAVIKPQAVIFDTDYNSDCDDVAALRLLLAQRRRGVIDLLAVVASSTPSDNNAAQAIEAHLYDEDAAAVPLGAYVGTGPNGAAPVASTIRNEFPHPTPAGSFENSIRTLRRALAAHQGKGDVNYVCAGFLTNLSALLQSPADDLSTLTGSQLLASAVSRVIIMGGFTTSTGTETNYGGDKTATAYVLANCPVPQEWHRTDVGGAVQTGTVLNHLPTTDLVRRAFEVCTIGAQTNFLGTGRNSYDPIVALSGCYSSPEAIGLTRTPATVSFDAAAGTSTFTPTTGATNYYVSRTAPQIPGLVATIDALLVPGLEPPPLGSARIRTGTALPWNPGKSVPVRDDALLASATTPRIVVPDRAAGTHTGSVTVTAGKLFLLGFTPARTISLSNLWVMSRGTAAVGTTLARLGLFTVDAAGNATLVARTASDTTILSGTFAQYQRALDTTGGYPASYTVVAGKRYAIGLLVVGATTAPIVFGTSGSNAVVNGWLPWTSMSATAQTDMATSYAIGTLTAEATFPGMAAF